MTVKGRAAFLVRRQRRKPLVAPAREFGKLFRCRLLAPLLQNVRDVRVLEHLDARGLRLKPLVEAGVARAVVRDAAGRVQLDGGERAHERPAQAEAVLDGLVEILRRHVALADQPERLGEQRALQPVEDEALDLAAHHDRHLLDLLVDLLGARDRLRRGPRRADQLDDRHQMRRVHRMRDEAARAALEVFGEQARHDRRRGRGQDRVGRRERVEFGEDRALGLDGLGHVLLHVARAVERVGDAFRRAHALRRAFRVGHEAMLRQFVEPFGDEPERLVGDAVDRVVHRGVPARAREHHGPGAADQARSDDGNAGHVSSLHIHNFCRRSSRSSRSSFDWPVQVTAPRSRITVRSESASARSR